MLSQLRLPSANLVEVSLKAGHALANYIIGCQPGARDRYVYCVNGRWVPRRHCPGLQLDDTEPDNVQAFCWTIAYNELRLAHPEATSAELVELNKAMLIKAAALAEHWARQEGLDLPLCPPQKFREFGPRTWSLVASYFHPRSE